MEQQPLQRGEAEFLELSGKARLISVILKPVVLTMIVVIWLIRALTPTHEPGTATSSGGGAVQVNIATMAYKEDEGDSTGAKLAGSMLNALLFIGFITVMTFVFVLLFKYRCWKVIYGWLTFSVITLLGMLGALVFWQLLIAYNLSMDWVTFVLIIWNFAVVGLLSIFWESPEQITHAYLVCVSVFLAYIFNTLPEWTGWMVLGFLIAYDLMAVLCPGGPLKMLVEASIDQDQAIPGLLYDATLDPPSQSAGGAPRGAGSGAAPAEADEEEGGLLEHDGQRDRGSSVELGMTAEGDVDLNEDPLPGVATDNLVGFARTPETVAAPPLVEGAEESDDAENWGEDSLKLGLGDFVFYSVLVARAAKENVSTVATCFLAVITGLCMTLFLLAIAGKALPALPISLTIGISYYFLCVGFVVPAVWDLDTNLAFV